MKKVAKKSLLIKGAVVKPPPSSLLERVHRRQCAIEKSIKEQAQLDRDAYHKLGLIHRALDTLTAARLKDANNAQTLGASLRTLTSHCERLLREKETLVKMIGTQEIGRRLREANDFMAAPVTRN